MIAKINVEKILRDHWRTLRDGSDDHISKGDLLLFFGLPCGATALLVAGGARINPESAGVLLAAFSILTGLLFNLLVLLLSLIERREINEGEELEKIKEEQKRLVLEQTFGNISYCILLGIVLSIVCVGGLYKKDGVEWVCMTLTLLLSFGGFHFALTLLMILKRIHNLVDTKFAE
jgi:hypothetical protein